MSVDRIRFHAKQIRDLGDLRELAANLRVEGMHQALLVQKRGDMIEVVDGHRRLAAARLARLKTVPVVIQDWRPDADVVSAMVTTDIHKKRLSLEEKRAAVQALRADHWTVPEIAERWGVATSTVYGWLTEPKAPAAAPDVADVPTAPAAPVDVDPAPVSPAEHEQAPSMSAAQADRTPRAPRPKFAPVWVQSLLELVARWEMQCGPDGLRLDDATEMFGELRALTGEVAR
jgi:ParB/RepB/Spo0J family partition protein